MSFHHHDILIKIAVADDHILFRETLCKTINDWEDCKVIVKAETGQQLIDYISAENLPSIVLTDLKMPELNGYEVIRILKKKFPGLKIMVISMFESEETMLLILKAGAEGFIPKTVDPEHLRKAIHDVLHVGYYFPDQSVARIFKQTAGSKKSITALGLTDEELVFIRYLCSEKTYKEIAMEMCTTDRHIEYLRKKVFEHLGLQSRAGLVLYATKTGLFI